MVKRVEWFTILHLELGGSSEGRHDEERIAGSLSTIVECHKRLSLVYGKRRERACVMLRLSSASETYGNNTAG